MRRTHLLLTLATLLCPACAVEYDDDDEFRFVPDTGGNSGGGTVFNTNELDKIGFSELTPKAEQDPPIDEVPIDLPPINLPPINLPPIGPPPIELPVEQPMYAVNDPSLSSYMPGYDLRKLILADGLSLAGFKLDGDQLIGFDTKNKTYTGDELLDSTWTIHRGGGIHTMTLADAELINGVQRYGFTHTDQFGVVTSTCPPGVDGTGTARLLAGFSLNENSGRITDSPETTYFACDTGATGKAADLGFYDVSLEHNAEIEIHPVKNGLKQWGPLEVAIRVLRADYCYSGHSYTKPHTPVWIEDRWGVIGPKAGKLNNPIEAIWGADGLLCRGTGRQVDFGVVNCELDIGETDPPMCKSGQTRDSFPGALFLTRKIVGD